MKRTTFRVILRITLLSLLLFAAGCRGRAPIMNVVDQSIPNSRALSLDEVTKAIVSSGAGLGWNMNVVSPGTIKGTLNLRSHTAIVDIRYTATSYSITYADSVNLKYDAAENAIHPNYNGWVQNLDRTIKAKLASL